MTLTCDTSLSRHRQRTELQFAFYKNRQNILRFGLSNQYGVQSALLKDSGNYFCEVKTSTTNVLKRSPMLHIQIQGRPSKEDGKNPEGNIPKNHSTPNKPKEEDKNSEGDLPPSYTTPNKPKEEDKNSEGDLPPSYTTPNKPKEEDKNSEGGLPPSYTTPNKPKEEDKNSEGGLPPSYTTPNKPKEEDKNSEGGLPPSYTTPNKPTEEDNSSEGEIPKNYTTSNIIRLVLSGFIVIGVVIVLYWHIKMYCKEERIAATTTLSLRPCGQSEMH
ncbi:sporozoite surface protein 2-like [Rana temporaria]|uniref:sporozoite surface protein 2-like n=1 Tax=Rana temporaria TaxID=8407 RepID=UPI001AAD606B|nr:sporozoite surface protein 2-like [Rana temporaria]